MNCSKKRIKNIRYGSGIHFDSGVMQKVFYVVCRSGVVTVAKEPIREADQSDTITYRFTRGLCRNLRLYNVPGGIQRANFQKVSIGSLIRGVHRGGGVMGDDLAISNNRKRMGVTYQTFAR